MSVAESPEQASAPDPKLALAQQMTEAGDADKIERALTFAALSGRFRPDDALKAAGFAEPEGGAPSLARLAAVARLVEACDTRLWQPDWIMRGPARERCIERMDGRSAEIVAWRRKHDPFGNVPRDICDALVGSGDFAPHAIDAVLASRENPAETYEHLIRGIALALPLAPGRDRLDELRAALARVQSDAAVLGDAGEHAALGREEEIARIGQSITGQWAESNAAGSLRALYICGPSRTGKSNLLTEIRTLRAAREAVCVTLDFDRPGIEGNDPLALARETARQIAEALGAPGAGLYRAIDAISAAAESLSGTPRIRAHRLLEELAGVLSETRRPVLLVLDSLENLTQHGDSTAFDLLEWLRTARILLPRLAIVGAGRRPLPAKFAREVETLVLGGLPEAAARRRLAARPVAEAAADELIAFADGDPAILALAAKFARAKLPAAQAPTSVEASNASKAYALFSQLIERIADPGAQKLARAGLLLRQVNAGVLAEVVAPLLGLKLSLERAAEMLGQFGENTWLVEEHDGWLVHCPEQRRILLDRQIAEHPLQAVRLFKAASQWHERHGQPVLALYYRLQVFRWRRRPPAIDHGLAIVFSDDMIRELPRKAQDLVAIVRGERSTRLRAAAPAQGSEAPRDAFDMADVAELRMLLHRRNHAEAAAMVARVEDFSAIDPASSEAAAVIESLWRAGRWEQARALLKQRRQRLSGSSVVARDLAAMCAAFADLDPQGFRSVLREQRGFAELLFEVSEAHGDAADWDVAGLLLLAEGFATRSTFAQATWTLWTGDAPSPGEAAGWIKRLARGRRATAMEVTTHADLMVALLPDPSHTRMLQNRLQMLPGEQLALVGPLVSAMLRTLDGSGDRVPLSPMAASYAVDHADACGALAPVVSTLAVLHPEAGFADIADAARLRMATVAGYWSYGDVPSAWRQPLTDHVTAQRITRFSDPPELAREEIERWRMGFDSGARAPFTELVALCEGIARAAPLAFHHPDEAALQKAAQQFIDAGMPLVFSPIFAILAASGLPGATIGTTINSSSQEG